MYQVLYRKYRSQTFSEIVGQPFITKSLKQSVERGKIGHAYLFSGPRGTGKTSAARILAKAINCLNPMKGDPDNICYICKSITKGNLEDVIEIDAASNNGVDEIREIRNRSTYAPSVAKYKVYIVDEVHVLSIGAFNAFLKTLEEPKKNVVFILATTECYKIPETVLSRVQRFDFRSISTVDIQQHLSTILIREGVSFDEQALSVIARCSEGGMRDALSILDRSLSLVVNKHLTTEVVEEMTGVIRLGDLDNYVASLLSRDSSTALRILDIIFNSGKSMTRFVIDLLQYLRDILVAKYGGEHFHRSRIFTDNSLAPQHRIFEMINLSMRSFSEIKNSSQPKIYAEVMTLRLVMDTGDTNELVTSIKEKMEELENAIKILRQEVTILQGQIHQPRDAKPSLTLTQSGKIPDLSTSKIYSVLQGAMENPDLARSNLTKIQEVWEEVVDSLSGVDKALISDSNPVAANGKHVILAFESDFNAIQVMKRKQLITLCGNILGSIVGFSLEVIAISMADWKSVRSEFASTRRDKVGLPIQQRDSLMPDSFGFLEEKITFRDD